MDIIVYKKAVEFFSKLGKNRGALQTEYGMVTKQEMPRFENHDFTLEPPESVGLSSRHLLQFIEELAAKPSLCPHSLMIARSGIHVAATSFYPYRLDTWHVSHSLCKSFTSMAIGMLLDRGKLSLDEHIVDIFAKRKFRLELIKKKDITVRHLLTMTAGVSFNEIGSGLTDDWVEEYFDSSMKFEAGSDFMYNSLNSYILSAIVTEKTGMTMLDFLKENLFHPMGITEVYWETCPKGITKGGWGLYMTLPDLMKVGTMLLGGGVYEGKRYLSSSYIHDMSVMHVKTDIAYNAYGYGYQVWGSCRDNSYQFNGMLGQNLILFPDCNVCIGIYSGSTEFFPTCALMDLVNRYFGKSWHPSEEPLPKSRDVKKLRDVCEMLANPPKKRMWERKPKLEHFAPVLNKKFIIDAQNIGVLPLVMSCFHRNFSSGIKSIAFEKQEDGCTVLFEKENETVAVPCLTCGAKSFDFAENGEHFYATSIMEMTENEDRIPVFKLRLYFTETTSVRTVKLFFYDDKTEVVFSENPTGRKMLQTFMPILKQQAESNKALKLLLPQAETPLFAFHVDRLFTPIFPVKDVENL